MPEPRVEDASTREALRAIEERLERATAAAERLLAETGLQPDGPRGAGREATDADAADPRTAREVPGAGFAADAEAEADGEASAGPGRTGTTGGPWIDPADLARGAAALAGILERLPADLQARLLGALRELLLAVRALVDWALERAERRRSTPREVQDIPVL